MSYQKGPTTNINNQSKIDEWTIRVNDREWTLTATRYLDGRDGSESKPFWRIQETGDNRRNRDGSVDIYQPYDNDGATEVKVNWACRGAQPIDETLRFKQDIGTAIQAATEAEYIINHEA